MKDVVRNLERAGLVERAAHPDHGRILTLHLTERGQAVLERADCLVEEVERQLLAPFTQSERATFVESLRRAGDALTADRAGGKRQPEGSA